ncbi:BrnA antitoxin family protein [Acidithiobacillus sp. MC6.1]|nr:BrnA antitoxin family protein [Acidithiobacillus sp. MC6.1]
MSKNGSNIVKRILDPNNLPPLTAQERAQLEAVSAMPDEQIDYSDAPYRPDAAWMKAVDRLPRNKEQISLRVDPEVMEFFRGTGKRYQSRMNAVLRSYVEAQRERSRSN